MNYENLPVYKETYDLLLFAYQHTGKMQRQYRFTLAEEMKRSLQELLISIYQANIVRNKGSYISQARLELVRVRVCFRLMRDLHQLSEKQMAFLTEKIASISKQLVAWEKYNNK